MPNTTKANKRRKMESKDWSRIKFFSKEEVASTGALPSDVTVDLMNAIDSLRKKLRAPIFLLHNGMTTGNHKSKYHPNGEAVDIYFAVNQSNDFLYKLFRSAIDCGFRGIGMYKNTSTGGLSYHLDLRPDTTVWVARKTLHSQWTYTRMQFGLPAM